MVKPACMPNTRNAATSVQTVLSGLMMSPGLAVSYGVGAGLSASALADWVVDGKVADASVVATEAGGGAGSAAWTRPAFRKEVTAKMPASSSAAASNLPPSSAMP